MTPRANVNDAVSTVEDTIASVRSILSSALITSK